MFFAVIKKSPQLSLFLSLSLSLIVLSIMLCMFQGLSPNYNGERYDVVFPGSEMPEWFSHQCMRDEVNIMEPFSHLCNDWIGIVVCIVFCPLPHHQIHGNPVSCILSANGKEVSLTHIIDNEVVASLDHIWLLYLLP